MKMALAIPAGIAAGYALSPASIEVNESVTEITGHPTGNAGSIEMADAACQDEENATECYENYDYPSGVKISGVVFAPIFEEFGFRALPSMWLDEKFDKGGQDALDTIKHGTDYVWPTRNEIIVGALSSVAFGLLHNLTQKGVDTRTIPASQTASGFAYWVLQRRLGIAANISAHATLNYSAFYKQR